MNVITVKVIRVPGGTVTEIGLETPTTVAAALSAANIEVQSTEKVSLDGAPTSMDSALSDGQRIIVSQGAKGNGHAE